VEPKSPSLDFPAALLLLFPNLTFRDRAVDLRRLLYHGSRSLNVQFSPKNMYWNCDKGLDNVLAIYPFKVTRILSWNPSRVKRGTQIAPQKVFGCFGRLLACYPTTKDSYVLTGSLEKNNFLSIRSGMNTDPTKSQISRAESKRNTWGTLAPKNIQTMSPGCIDRSPMPTRPFSV